MFVLLHKRKHTVGLFLSRDLGRDEKWRKE